jgi:maleylpyruvate isomerase
MADDELLEPLHHSDQHVIRTVDSLTDDQWREPSLLPDWSRAHVVAHLALNAEAFDRALNGVQDGETVPIYDSNDARDADIQSLAAEEPSTIRQRFFAATTALRHTFGSLTTEQWHATVNRLPEGPVWPVAELLTARRREVEIHHADLGLGYTHRNWPADFCVVLLDAVTGDHGDSPESPGFAVAATDLDRSWAVGADSPVIRGTAADLGWWLVGRGHGDGLTDELPQLGPWRRSPLR